MDSRPKMAEEHENHAEAFQTQLKLDELVITELMGTLSSRSEEATAEKADQLVLRYSGLSSQRTPRSVNETRLRRGINNIVMQRTRVAWVRLKQTTVRLKLPEAGARRVRAVVERILVRRVAVAYGHWRALAMNARQRDSNVSCPQCPRISFFCFSNSPSMNAGIRIRMENAHGGNDDRIMSSYNS